MKIMHIWNGTVLFDAPDATSVQAAVLAAVKARANLSGADLSDARIETGETLDEYARETGPALIAAGGHPVPESAWSCHAWKDSKGLSCPMASAFGIASEAEAPRLLRPRVEQFIRLYDSGIIMGPPDKNGHLRVAGKSETPAENAV